MTDGFDRGKAFRLFEQALGLDESARAEFIRDRCGGDASLHAELEALLEAATADSGLTGVLFNSTARPIENLIGEQFGRFRLVEFIGEGGMGVVYRAERTDGIKQTVAIKLIGNELASRGQERFRRETQMLARLEHPAIARLIDAGVEAGRAWIALEFVAGRPIDAYCDERQLPLRARVRLLADLAGAVAAAHRMLVVHRDIKPVSGAIAYALQARQAAEAREMTARRGEFLQTLLKSADPRGGNRDVTVAQLLDGSAREIESLTLREPLVGASMLGLVAETNLGLGRLPEGLAASSREIELLRTHDGGSANLSAALSVRGQLLIKSGRYREAEAPLLEAVSLVEHLRGAEKQLGEALDDLGAAYQDSEREAQAELMYKRALDVYRKGGKALGVAASDPVANLGVLRYNEGRYAESAAYMREAVEIRGKYLPRDHPEMLDAEYNYATSLERNHQAGAAEPIFRELLASYQRTLGPIMRIRSWHDRASLTTC